jgi:hypothetical protein
MTGVDLVLPSSTEETVLLKSSARSATGRPGPGHGIDPSRPASLGCHVCAILDTGTVPDASSDFIARMMSVNARTALAMATVIPGWRLAAVAR